MYNAHIGAEKLQSAGGEPPRRLTFLAHGAMWNQLNNEKRGNDVSPGGRAVSLFILYCTKSGGTGNGIGFGLFRLSCV